MRVFRRQLLNQVCLVLPTNVKTIAENNDYFIGIDRTGTPYRISKTDLLAGLLSNSGSSTGIDTDTALTYISGGDNNGLFYFLGTQKKTASWVNPSGNGLTLVASSIQSGSLLQLCDRQGSDLWTIPNPDQWIKLHIETGKLKINYYSLKSRLANIDYYPRNWKLQASNDNNTWIDLDIQVDNAGLNAVDQWLSLPVVTSDSYSDFRLFVTGLNSSNAYHLCLGEVEFYGIYTP